MTLHKCLPKPHGMTLTMPMKEARYTAHDATRSTDESKSSVFCSLTHISRGGGVAHSDWAVKGKVVRLTCIHTEVSNKVSASVQPENETDGCKKRSCNIHGQNGDLKR